MVVVVAATTAASTYTIIVVLAKVFGEKFTVVQIVVELFNVVVAMLIEAHFNPNTELLWLLLLLRSTGAAEGWLEELVTLIKNSVFVYELLKAPVVRFAESIYRVLDVDVLAPIVHNAEHHLYLDWLVAHVLKKNGEEVFAVGAGAVRVKYEPPLRRLLGGAGGRCGRRCSCCRRADTSTRYRLL